ncbi:hypothetical protein L3Q82_003539 [Scortum barcoo]|uniref:Uncharacterized protein n=1 Tax=Scortum barcoo TaxID=214431 RepID=A0ACB8VMI1_9TELE|nr:hypothetical protein L3Q82_003539 [Scortum barcoo]
MDPHHPSLIGDCLIYIFAFLDEEDLISSSSVCQDWHEAAETPWLWRRMCLQRWSFCNLAASGGEHSWKRYFPAPLPLGDEDDERPVGRLHLQKPPRARRVAGFAYLRGNSAQLPDLWSGSATVCSASADGTVRAWSIQNGELLWCSPVQSPLTGIVRDEKGEVVITADSTGLIKTWQGQTGQELASFPAGSGSTLHITAVGTGQGSVCTLADSALIKKSSVMVCDSFKVNILLVSPDKKWITAGSKDNDDLSPKVIYSESLTSPSEDDDPLCQSVPVAGCQAAVFIPTQPARLAIIHPNERPNNKAVTVFDVSIKKTKYKTEIQGTIAFFSLSFLHMATQVVLHK